MGKNNCELLKDERNYRSKSRVNWSPLGKHNFGLWTDEEKKLFIKGHEMYGKNWIEIAKYVGTRDDSQVRSHAQKCLTRDLTLKGKLEKVELSHQVIAEQRATRSKASGLPKREQQIQEETPLSHNQLEEQASSPGLANEVIQQAPQQKERSISKSQKKNSKKGKTIKKLTTGKKNSAYNTPQKGSKKKSQQPSQNKKSVEPVQKPQSEIKKSSSEKKKSAEKEVQVDIKAESPPAGQNVLRRSRRQIKKKYKTSPQFQSKDNTKKERAEQEVKMTPPNSQTPPDKKSIKIRKSPRNGGKNKQKKRETQQNQEDEVRSIIEFHDDSRVTRHVIKVTKYTQTEFPCQSSYYLRKIDKKYLNFKKSNPSAFKEYVEED